MSAAALAKAPTELQELREEVRQLTSEYAACKDRVCTLRTELNHIRKGCKETQENVRMHTKWIVTQIRKRRLQNQEDSTARLVGVPTVKRPRIGSVSD